MQYTYTPGDMVAPEGQLVNYPSQSMLKSVLAESFKQIHPSSGVYRLLTNPDYCMTVDVEALATSWHEGRDWDGDDFRAHLVEEIQENIDLHKSKGEACGCFQSQPMRSFLEARLGEGETLRCPECAGLGASYLRYQAFHNSLGTDRLLADLVAV